MFDDSKTKKIGFGSAGSGEDGRGDNDSPSRKKQILNWSTYTVAELVRFRDEITKKLPPLALKDLNLEEQVLLQYHTMRELQGDVMEDEMTPANQRAQVANGVGAVLKTLADKQTDLYTTERFKDIENLLIRTLGKLPEELAAGFITEYEKLLLRHD